MEVASLTPARALAARETDEVLAYLAERAEQDGLPPRSVEVADAIGWSLGETVAVLRMLASVGVVRWANGWQISSVARLS